MAITAMTTAATLMMAYLSTSPMTMLVIPSQERHENGKGGKYNPIKMGDVGLRDVKGT